MFLASFQTGKNYGNFFVFGFSKSHYFTKNAEISFSTFLFLILLSNLINLTQHYRISNNNKTSPEAVEDISVSHFKSEENKSINNQPGKRIIKGRWMQL